MPIFGRYEVVEELYTSPTGVVSRAKLVDGRQPNYVVKLFLPPGLEDDELHWQTQAFLERVRIQQQASAAAEARWAPIRHQGTTPGGAFYVTDYYAQTAKTLVEREVVLGEHSLHRIVDGVLLGLSELRQSVKHPHGNLKPSNVLLATRGKGLDGLRVALTDPASAAAAASSGDAADRRALGDLIYQLVLHEPYAGGPVEDSPPWLMLGAKGPDWRHFCDELLLDEADAPTDWSKIAQSLAALLQGRLRAAAPARPARPRRFWGRAAAFVLFVGVVLSALNLLGMRATRDFCSMKSSWLGALSAAASDPSRRRAWEQDPDLRQMLADLDRTAPQSVDCDTRGFRIDPLRYWRLRNSLASAHATAADLSADHWKQLGQLYEAARQFEARGWRQPADFLGSEIAASSPGAGHDLPVGIDRILTTAQTIDRELPPLDSEWSKLADKTRTLEAAGDATLIAFATHLRNDAGTSLRLQKGGFSGLEPLHADVGLAEKLALATHIYPKKVDQARFNTEVTSHLDFQHLTSGDILNWIERLADYTFQNDAIASASAALHDRLGAVLKQIDASRPDSSEKLAIGQDEQKINADLNSFSQSHFIARDLNDGVFGTERTRLESEIDGLLGYLHRRNPNEWIRSLAALGASSDVVNGWWEDWKHVLETNSASMSQNGELFSSYKQATDKLRPLLRNLAETFPKPPDDLSGPLLSAAKDRRERDLGRLLAGIDPKSPPKSFPDSKNVADNYTHFCSDLRELGKDFPIRKEILSLNDRPDLTWARAKPDVWNDPSVQALVKKDLQRIAQLQDLKRLSRQELIDAATSYNVPEICFSAWQLMGGNSVNPLWPTRPGELEAERDLRVKLEAILHGLRSDAERASLEQELSAQGPERWRRFVQAANSEAMLRTAASLESFFGINAAQVAKLPAEARFNLELLQARQDASQHAKSQAQDADVRKVVASILKSARELPDRQRVESLLAKLGNIDAKDPLAERRPGDRFTLTVAGAQPPLEFVRVEPQGSRPFYLCTTELSFGQFAGVIDAASAWDRVKQFRWPAVSGQRDVRRGPRIWEWSRQSALQMTAPLLWLAREDENDYPLPYRVSRFNRTALNEEVGGNPSTDHPMQYIPADAALYFAGLCGCRLPTTNEWRDAYAIFEKTVPAERWNLRDQTWETFKRYVASTAPANPHWPDEGIFRPPLDTSPSGADARGRGDNDGTLFFRKVSAPGGGTFHQLIGNVAELLCDSPDAFENWAEKSSAEGIRKFLAQNPGCMKVIGGSALSPPELPIDKPLPLPSTDTGWADVGLRPAFSAPARSLAEKLKWALEGQTYLWPRQAPATRP